MTRRVAFATAPIEHLGHDDRDRPFHDRACASAGFVLEHRVWSDPDVPWDAYDLVVVRSTWDYLDHVDDFRTWLGRVGALGTLQNPAPVIAWNLDKHYLVDLAGAGVPVVPTTACATRGEADRAIAEHPGEVVVKPSVSAGSRHTGRFVAGDPVARQLAGRILDGGTAVLVQPSVSSVGTDGEISTLVFEGEISHSVRKGPLLALGGGLVGGTYTEHLAPVVLSPSREAVVQAAAAAVGRLMAERFGVSEPLLYARIDVVTLDDGTDAVLEAELAEPAFFLETDPAAAGRFADAVARRLGAGRR